MSQYLRRLIALCLCLASIAGFIPAIAPAIQADAAMYSSYTTIAKISTQGGCNAMQGMDVDGTYIYCAKINSETETTCSIARVHKTSGDIVYLKNSATGTNYFSQLAHANDLAVCTVKSVKTMFVGTGGAGKGDYSLVRFSFNGTTLTEVGHYNMKYNGAEKYIAGVKVVATSSTDITLVLKSGNYVYTATIPYSTTSGDIAMNYLGKLDFSAVNFGGTIRDLSNYVVQGFGYKDNKLFVPMSANYQTSTSHISTIVCFDIDGMKGGSLKPDPNFSVWIEDTTYPDLFEIESCAICPTDGKLYFGTNCRKSSTDGNHDGIHVLNSFVYNPAMGDLSTGQNYYFQTSSNKLQTVTTANSVFNSALQHLGTVSGNKITGGRWSIDMPIILKHNDPWIITWEATNWTGNSLLLSTYDTSSFSNNYYLYRRSDGLVALGYYGSSNYHNYGVSLTSHSIDGTVNHKYQLKNQVNADGTNMVYLWVDGTKLGAMNNYYVGATSQNTTNNWVSGKDFSFSYVGTAQHPVSGTLKYLKVWTKGNLNAFDEPSVFRWETQNDQMTPISQFGYTANAVTVLGGSCTDGTYSSYYNRLAQPVVLMHDRPWVMEWKTPSWSGNTMLFSSGDTALKLNASYLYRSTDIVALGYCDGSKCHSYGILLADHGIDAAAGHTYRMTNKINADGSNMVYLSVDGTELGPMNRYYLGSEYQNEDSDWVSGKDYTFPYMGNYHYGLKQAYEYIQVWENGIPADNATDHYRWEGSGSSFKNITTDEFTPNTANRVIGSISNSVFNEATYRLDTPIVLQHDKRWSISWESSGTWAGSAAGGAFLFSASQNTSETNAPYLYRRKNSSMIGFGIYDGSRHIQCGLQLSDFGIDGAASHTYTLTNRINADGSNMVYLSVDGVELGAMNNYFVGAAPQGTTSNWISGKDFTFPYLGTPRFPLSNVTLNYLEVNEDTHTHSYGSWTITEEATCTVAGSQSRSCTICGDVQTEVIAATDHSYQASVIAPSCTSGGYTTYTCSICGDSYQTDEKAATGHSYKTTVTPSTCTESGFTTDICTVCGYSNKTAYTSPIGHSYQATVSLPSCTAYGVITYTCSNCDDSYQEQGDAPTGHNYVSGVCTVCGAEDSSYIQAPAISLKYPSVTFEDEVLMNVFFTVDSMDAVWELGLITFENQVAQADIDMAKDVIPGYTYDVGSGMLYATTNGIAAKELGDDIWFCVYALLTDGSYVYSKVVSYSPSTYAYSQLSDPEMAPLVVAMLNYGAAAQVYFNYRTDALVNADLTAEQQGLIESYRSDMVAGISSPSDAKAANFIRTATGFAKRYPTITFEGAFSIDYFCQPSFTPQGDITLYYWDQTAYDAADILSVNNANGALILQKTDDLYAAAVEGIAAKDLDKGIYVAFVYSDGTNTYCSGILGYSIGTYCVGQAATTDAMAPFAAATAVYGYYAKQLFEPGV